MSRHSYSALTRDQLTQAAAIFQAAREKAAVPTVTKTDTTQPFDPHALAIFYTDEMHRLAAPARAKDIIFNFDASLLSAQDRWSRLPAASRRILENYQLCSGIQLRPEGIAVNGECK
jgi:hypothetical protein